MIKLLKTIRTIISMSNESVQISVVLGTFNQVDTLKKVLFEYEHQTINQDLFEVIVIDSSSTDGSKDFYESYTPSFNFRYFIQENKGKASARNRGVELARGRYIIVTDADMIPHKDFIKTHFEAQIKSKEDRCFEGQTLNMTQLEWPTSNKNLTPYIQKKIQDKSKLGWYYFLTGNISFPKSLFIQNNGFNETFLNYGWEDLELGYRLQQKGVPLFYLTSAKNYHYHVVTKEEEIERNVKKGESAKILVQLHPKLKLFCGLNPISKFIFPLFKKEGRWYQFLKNKGLNSNINIFKNFSFWFLKEHQYMKGILSK